MAHAGIQLPPKPVVKPSTKMKQLNWTKIPNNKVVSSYWKDVSEVDIEIDSNEVELLFAAREDKKGAHTHHFTQHTHHRKRA
jgi:hypothetical protein